MTHLEGAEMRFVESVKGYTRLDKIRSEVIRKELEISGIKEVRSKHKQNWINHLETMENNRLPKHALNYKPRGRRDRGRPRKRWQRVDAGTGQTTYSMEEDDDDNDDEFRRGRSCKMHVLNTWHIISNLSAHHRPIPDYTHISSSYYLNL